MKIGIYEALEHGQGLPLVMLHGMMGEPGNWAGVFPTLPASCRAVALKFPFFKDGVALDSVPAVKAYARGFLDQVGFEKFVLCGNSLGGHVSLDLALEMPDRVAGLVLTGSSGLFERTFGTVVSRPPREWVYDKVREIFYHERHATPEMVERVVDAISKRPNVRTLVSIAKSAKRDNVAERARRIVCPALLIWGRQDLITPPQVAEEFHQYLPNSQLAWVDECGHAPMMEHPETFAAHVSEWWLKYICPQG